MTESKRASRDAARLPPSDGRRVPEVVADDRKRLRGKWYAEELAALTIRMLLLVGSIALLQFLVYGLLTGKTKFIVATGESLEESMLSAGLGTLVIYVWPLVAVALLRVLRWRELLRVAGFAVLIATTIRGLTVMSADVLAVANSGGAIEKRSLGALLDPFEWAFIVIGGVMCARAWRLAGRANQILPDESRAASMTRKVWSRGLLATTGIYALLCFGFVAVSGYEIGAYMNQPGVDPQREHQALLALNEGVTHSNKKDFAAAEKSFQQSLRIWEDLASKPGRPFGLPRESGPDAEEPRLVVHARLARRRSGKIPQPRCSARGPARAQPRS